MRVHFRGGAGVHSGLVFLLDASRAIGVLRQRAVCWAAVSRRTAAFQTKQPWMSCASAKRNCNFTSGVFVVSKQKPPASTGALPFSLPFGPLQRQFGVLKSRALVCIPKERVYLPVVAADAAACAHHTQPLRPGDYSAPMRSSLPGASRSRLKMLLNNPVKMRIYFSGIFNWWSLRHKLMSCSLPSQMRYIY